MEPSLLLWPWLLIQCGSWEPPIVLCSDEAEHLQLSSGSASFTPQLRGPLSPTHPAHFCLSFPWYKRLSLPCISISEVRNSFSSQLNAPAVLAFAPAPPQGLRGSNTRLSLSLPHTPQHCFNPKETQMHLCSFMEKTKQVILAHLPTP